MTKIDSTLNVIETNLDKLTNSESRQQGSYELTELENEYIWVQVVEMESQQRATSNLLNKLETDIAENQNKLPRFEFSSNPTPDSIRTKTSFRRRRIK